MDKKKIALIGGAVTAGLAAIVSVIFIGKRMIKKTPEKNSVPEEVADVEEDN